MFPSHCAAEEAEATVQGERGGQEAQAAQSPERSKSLRLTPQLLLPDVLLDVCLHFLSCAHHTRDIPFIVIYGIQKFLVSMKTVHPDTQSGDAPAGFAAPAPEMSSFPASLSRRSQFLLPV